MEARVERARGTAVPRRPFKRARERPLHLNTASQSSALQTEFLVGRSHSPPEMFCEDKSYINAGVIGVEVINQRWFRPS